MSEEPRRKRKASVYDSDVMPNPRAAGAGAAGGDVDFDDDFIADLVRREALACEGLTALTPTFMEGLRAGGRGGITIRRNAEGVRIELRAAVAFGADCVRLFEEIRGRVAGKVRETTGLYVAGVDLRVTGVLDKGAAEEIEWEDPYIDF
jgi:uncharacterized alkaline shock family protein YloU